MRTHKNTKANCSECEMYGEKKPKGLRDKTQLSGKL